MRFAYEAGSMWAPRRHSEGVPSSGNRTAPERASVREDLSRADKGPDGGCEGARRLAPRWGSVLSASLGAAHQGRHLLRTPFSRWVDTLLNQAGARDAPPRRAFLLWRAPVTRNGWR